MSRYARLSLAVVIPWLAATACQSSGGSSGSGEGGSGAHAADGSGAAGGEASGGAGGETAAGGTGESGGTPGNGGADNTGNGGTANPGNGGAGGNGGNKPNTGGTGGTSMPQGGTPAAGGAGNTGSAPCTDPARCDTFESYNPGARPGGPWGNFDAPAAGLLVDETRAFSGKRSVKIVMGEQTATMRHAGTGLLPANDVYMRMMVFLPAYPQGSLHWSWMRVEGNVNAESGGRLRDVFVLTGGVGGGNSWMLYGGGAPSGYQDCFARGVSRPPLNKWFCAEFHTAALSDSAETWIDGKRDDIIAIENGDVIPGVGGCLDGYNYTDGKWFVPRADRMVFGWAKAHTLTAPVVMWIDDVAVSDKRIGCPAAP